MKILSKLTIQDVKLNKKRSIVTIIGIILSVALICATAGLFTCFRATLLKETIESSGYYHVRLYDVEKQDIKKIENNRDIATINSITAVGYAKLEGGQNESKPYLHVYSAYNTDFFHNMSFHLLEGRFPENENEIVISSHIETNGGVAYHIGDRIHLTIGTRKTIDEEYELHQSNPYTDEEFLQLEVEKTFKVVGIMERPSYSFESSWSPGYTVITMGLETNKNTDLYIAFKKPQEYKKSISELTAVKETSIEKCDYQSNDCGEEYRYSTNRELLRWEVLDFSEGTFNMLLSVVSIVIIIIMGTSIFVIRNAFAISITEKSKMMGMLKSIGATKKQMKRTVIFEGMLLGMIAIPIGVLSGILAVYILTIIVNVLVGDFLFGNTDGMVFHISWIPVIISIILGFITIYLSCLTSAKKASKISPIESIRNSKEYAIKSKKLKTPFIIKKLFKTGGVVAYKNLKRSSKKYRTTVISLVVSIFIFITMNAFINYAFGLSGMYYTDYDYNILINAYDEKDANKILSLPNIDSYSKTSVGSKAIEITDLHAMSEFAKTDLINPICEEVYDCINEKILAIEIRILDDTSYKSYVKKLGLDYEKVKDTAILNDYYYYVTKEGSKYNRVFTYKVGDSIIGTFDQNEVSIKVGAVTKTSPSGNENTYISGGFIYVTEELYYSIFNRPIMDGTITISSSDATQFEKDFKNAKISGYIFNIEESVKQERAMILVISIFLYGFITVITLIGVTNIFNTITTNMKLRQKEFAILKSIGMTKKEFNRMINLETLFYSFKSLVIGIVLGIIGSYGIYKAFAINFDAGYQLPVTAIIISIIFVFLLVFIIMRFSLSKINKQNIIETIRNDNI